METALLLALDNVYKSLDLGSSTLLITLDLSAAFDNIDHRILLNRLHTRLGISSTALDWIRSYLPHRSQFVCIHYAKSGIAGCSMGAHQCSVIGPVPFPFIYHTLPK